jgi:hypothetical protein
MLDSWGIRWGPLLVLCAAVAACRSESTPLSECFIDEDCPLRYWMDLGSSHGPGFSNGGDEKIVKTTVASETSTIAGGNTFPVMSTLALDEENVLLGGRVDEYHHEGPQRRRFPHSSRRHDGFLSPKVGASIPLTKADIAIP